MPKNVSVSEWLAEQRRSGLHLDRVVEEKIKEGLGEKLEKDTLGFPLPLILHQHQSALPSLWRGQIQRRALFSSSSHLVPHCSQTPGKSLRMVPGLRAFS